MLLLPVVLYMLDLPNEGFSDSRVKKIEGGDMQSGGELAVAAQVGMLATPNGFGALAALPQFAPNGTEGTVIGKKLNDAYLAITGGKSTPMTFVDVSLAATSPETRSNT